MGNLPAQQYRQEYLDWKGWTAAGFARLTAGARRYFDAELRRTNLPLGAPLGVLEIGFGNGEFLAYARTRGWQIAGTELNPELVELARANGFHAICAGSLGEFPDAGFDIVVAFDVLEHIPQASMLEFLHDVVRVLKPGGIFLARFPNGDSPFGLLTQNGDVTHVSVIGSGKVEYFAKELRATIVFVGGEAEPVLVGNYRKSLYRLFAIPVRRFLNSAIRAIFFPSLRVAFCSANMVVVLRTRFHGR